jgi:hypothetical protein
MAARLGSILLLGLLVALFAGCGGDKRRGEAETTEATTQADKVQSPESSQPGGSGPVRVTKVTSPVRRAYVARVDAVCEKIEPERTKEQEKVGASTGSAEAVKAYEGAITLGWRELRQIEAISPPLGEEALLRANVFDPVKGQLALRAKIRDALANADVPLVRRLRNQLDNSTRALTGFARGYGFQVCGEQ